MAKRWGVSAEKIEELERRFEALEIREEDLTEKFVRASGAGGQKINKTSVAVYIKHEPTGYEVKTAANRSQAVNRYIARRMLCDRIEEEREGKQSAAQQKAEKIRRQKRRRSRRAKARMLSDKRKQGEKKAQRKKPRSDD